jgi:hypothetical protein
MKHSELLGDINSDHFMNSRTIETPYHALRAVVELHKPGSYQYFGEDICEHCTIDIDYFVYYPCPTIEAIEKELR